VDHAKGIVEEEVLTANKIGNLEAPKQEFGAFFFFQPIYFRAIISAYQRIRVYQRDFSQMEENEPLLVGDEPTEPTPQIAPGSPQWPSTTKRIVSTILAILGLLALYQIRSVLIPLIMSVVLAYIIIPVVNWLHTRTRLSLGTSTLIVYLVIIAALVAIPLSAVPPLVSQGNNLLNNTPGYIEQIGERLAEPIQVGGFNLPLDALHIGDLSTVVGNNLVAIVQAIAPQSLRLFGATLTTVGWILIGLLLSYYIVRDYRFIWKSIVALAPESYHGDIQRLGQEASAIWNAFLRGQLLLALIIGLITAVVAFIIGLPNALVLGLLAGLLEFIPNIGPVLAAIPALLLALFQYEISWLGSAVGPVWYGLIVLFIYGIIQRLENMFLLPRIIGRSLGLHALVVLIGAIIGASVAGIFGILLAAPLLATAKLLLKYIYQKLVDRPPLEELPLA